MGRGADNSVFPLINVNVFLFIIELRCFNDIFNTNKSTWRVMFRWAYHGILSHIRMNRGNQTFCGGCLSVLMAIHTSWPFYTHYEIV